MKVIAKKIGFVFGLLMAVLFFTSCILDEYKVSEIKMKEDWNLDIVSPLFHGDFEFKELIDDKSLVVIQGNEPTTTLQFSQDSFLTISSKLIFEPSIIIEDFSFLISGNYNLTSVNLEYTVLNGCPFSLNFQMRFYDKNSNVKGPAVLPPSFLPANFDGVKFIPEISKYIIGLNEEQFESFDAGNSVEFSAWFEPSDLINQQEYFSSDYPIEISIVLHGKVEK
jgi:hypothetical protein